MPLAFIFRVFHSYHFFFLLVNASKKQTFVFFSWEFLLEKKAFLSPDDLLGRDLYCPCRQLTENHLRTIHLPHIAKVNPPYKRL